MKHFILLSSSYSLGTRIALDFVLSDDNENQEIKHALQKIEKECGKDVSIAVQFIETESKEWTSVQKADNFFKDVKIIGSTSDFIDLIKKDRKLSSITVANYILTKLKCTHLQLEKLVYLCFADYLCDFDDKLFEDNIYAFKYGPVINQVYEKYKKFGREEISDIQLERIDSKYELPLSSLIQFSERGQDKLISIDNTIEKYSGFTASELVQITHRPESPWSKTFDKSYRKEIPDEIIKQFHFVEIV